MQRKWPERSLYFRSFPYEHKKVGIVTTGSEVYHGRIQDTFTPVIIDKVTEYGAEIEGHEICDDNPEMIEDAIHDLLRRGCNMILCTGGMSVDPDDRTPLAIKNVTGNVVSYGAPVLPGAMFLLAYYGGDLPVMGLPGCVMYAKRTVFDLVLPRIMAGEILDKRRSGSAGRRWFVSELSDMYIPELWIWQMWQQIDIAKTGTGINKCSAKVEE